MAVDEVCCEPISKTKFPANREKYREIRKLGRKSASRIFYVDESLRVLVPLADFVRRTEQGIISPTSGNS
jgi:hypothetical protein